MEVIMGVLVCVGLVVWLSSSRTKDRHMSQCRGKSVEGLAHQFKAVYDILEPDFRYATNKEPLYSKVIQQVVSRNARTGDDYGDKLVLSWSKVFKDSQCLRFLVEQAIDFCINDIHSGYRAGFGKISGKYISDQVGRVIPASYCNDRCFHNRNPPKAS